MFKIDKGVPVPETKPAEFPLGDLEIGDSFFVPFSLGIDGDNLRARMGYQARKLKIRLTVRKAVENGERGVRAWRIE